jgi:hypothetical protein
MEAKASSLTVFGKVCVTEMGRWREKKVERPRAVLVDVRHRIMIVAARMTEQGLTFW